MKNPQHPQRFRTLILMLIFLTSSASNLGACTVNELRLMFEGNLPRDERASIEQYEAEVFPALRAYVEDLAQRTGLTPEVSAHSEFSRYEMKYGISYLPKIVHRGNISCELMLELGNKHFNPLGYILTTQSLNREECFLDWVDPENGGVISSGIEPVTVTSDFSSVRPVSPDKTFDTYSPPEWENDYPVLEGSEADPQSE